MKKYRPSDLTVAEPPIEDPLTLWAREAFERAWRGAQSLLRQYPQVFATSEEGCDDGEDPQAH